MNNTKNKINEISNVIDELGPVVSTLLGSVGNEINGIIKNYDSYHEYVTTFNQFSRLEISNKLIKSAIEDVVIGAVVGLSIYSINRLYKNPNK